MRIENQSGVSMGLWVDDEGPVGVQPNDVIKILFRLYKQVIHLLGSITEEYNFLIHESVIMVRLSELRDPAGVMDSVAMGKIKRVLDIVLSSSETAMRHDVEQGILRIVRNPSTPSLVPPNHKIFVKSIDGIKITYDTCGKSGKKLINDHLEATKNATCAICTEDVNLREPSRLPCLHLFHHCCIMQWLQIKNECPTCRSPVPHEFVTWF